MQREIIRRFMRALSETTSVGRAAVDEALRACSIFDWLDGLIDCFIFDCERASSTEEFLIGSCGIDLNKKDTGAISGVDTSIVVKPTVVDYPAGTSFEIDGLTVNVRNTLDDIQRLVVRNLYSWQLKGALDLIKESYGENYSFDPRGAATVRELAIQFVSSGNFMARAGHRYTLKTGATSALALQINTAYYDVDGTWTGEISFERVLAHEMTHAVMAAHIIRYAELPACIKEGIAELTHGINDQRRSTIEELSSDATKLRAALSSSGGTMYAAGYMLMRYLAIKKPRSMTLTAIFWRRSQTQQLIELLLVETDDVFFVVDGRDRHHRIARELHALIVIILVEIDVALLVFDALRLEIPLDLMAPGALLD